MDYASEMLGKKAKSAEPDYAGELLKPSAGLAGSVMQPIANRSSFEGTADFGTLVKAQMVDDPQTRLRIFAKARFPDMPEAEALKRYAYVGEDAVYTGDDGKMYREAPPGLLGWLKENLAAGTIANALPIAGSTAGAIAGVPGGPLGIAAGAGIGGAAGKGYNKALANVAFDEPQSVAGNVQAMAIEGGVDAATAGIGSKVGQVIDRRRGARDLAKLDRVRTAMLHQKADAMGIELTPAELTNLASLRAQQKSLSNVPQSADVMDEFLARRTGQVRDATYRTLADISPQDSAEVAARRGVETAGEAVAAAVQQRAASASPIYQAAFRDFRGIPPNEMATVRDLQARLPRGVEAQAIDIARQEGVDLQNPANSLLGMHYIKVATDTVRKRLLANSQDNEARIVGENLRELNGLMDRISPVDDQGRSLYQLARGIYEHTSPAVESTKQGLTGAIAGKWDRNATQALDQLFSAERSGPLAVAKARREIVAQDEESWNGMLRAFLQQKFEKAGNATANSPLRPMQGAIFRAQMVGNKQQAEILSAAMSGKQWQAFNDLMEVLEATGRVKVSGSDTAWNQEAMKLLRQESGGALDNLIDPLGTPKRAVEYLREVRLGNHSEKLAEIITSPQGMRQLRKLKQLSPNDQRFIAGTAALLGTAVAPSSAEPIPQSLQLKRRSARP